MILTALISAANPVLAVAKTWSGGGTDGTCGGNAGDGNKWSCAANWTPSGAPATSDTVTFNSTSTKNAVIDASAAASVSSITISSGYTGTISLAKTFTITTFSQSDGTFDSTNQALTIGTYTLNTGATFIASSTNMNVINGFTVNGGTFTHNSGTVSFTGTAATLSCNNITFNVVSFIGQTGVKTVNSNCNLPLITNPTIPNGIILNGTLSGAGTITGTAGLWTLNTGSSLSGFSGFNIPNGLTVAGANADFSTYTTFSLFGAVSLTSGSLILPSPTGSGITMSSLTISGGTFTSSPGTVGVSGALTISGSPTFNANGGTFNFSGTTATLSCNNVTFNNVAFTGQTGVKTVNSNCSLPLGSNPVVPNGITLNGSISGSNTFTQTTGTFTLNSGSSFTGFTGYTGTSNALSLAGVTLDFSSYSPFAINGGFQMTSGTVTFPSSGTYNFATFTLSGGTFNAPSTTVNVSGTLQITGSPVFNANGSTFDFNGSGGTLACNNVTFNAVTFAGQTGAKTVSSNCNLPLGNNPIIPNGITLNGTLTATGTLTMTTGALTLNTGASLTSITGFTGTSNALAVAGATADLSAFSPLDINGGIQVSSGSLSLSSSGNYNISTFNLSGGTFNAPSNVMNISSTMLINGSPIFNANGGTVNFNGSSATLSCNNVTFANVTFSGQTGTKTVSSNCSLPLGANPTISNGITLSGTLTGSGIFTMTTGALTLNSSANFTGFTGITGTTNGLAVTGYTANFGSYSPFVLGDLLSLSSGSLTMPSGSASVGGALTFSGGTFNANGGTIDFNGGTATLSCNNVSFNSVNFTGQTGVKTVNSNCSLPLGANPTVPNGITLSGTLTGSGTFTMTTGTLTLNSTAVFTSFTGFTGTSSGISLVGITKDFSSYSPFDINGPLSTGTSASITLPNSGTYNLTTLTINGGTFNAPSGVLSVSGNLTISNSPVFNANGGTFNFNGGSAGLTCGNVTFNLVTFTGQTGTKSINSGCTLPVGADPIIPNGISLANGIISGSGVFTMVTGGLTYSGTTGGLSGFSSITGTSNSLTISGTANLSSFTSIDVHGAFNMNSASAVVTFPSGSITFRGLIALTSGATVNASSGTINLTTTGNFGCNGQTLNKVVFQHTGTASVSNCKFNLGNNPVIPDNVNITAGTILSGTGILTINGTLTPSTTATLSGFSGYSGSLSTFSTINMSTYTSVNMINLTVNSSGVFTAPSGTLNISGNFAHPGGLFVGNSGTVVFNGSSGTQSISGTTTFYNLKKQVTSASDLTLQFAANTTQTIAGTLTLDGFNATNRLNITSSTPNTQFSINPIGTRSMHYLNVVDSNNTNATAIDLTGTGSFDGGNNTNYLFDLSSDITPPNDFTPTLDVQSPTNNQTPILSFVTTDDVAIDHYEVKIDSGSFSIQTSPYTLPTLAEGDRTITVRAFDTSNNTTDGIVNVTIDITAPADFTPTLNTSSPTNNQAPELTFSTTDNVGIDHYEVKIDSDSFSTQASPYNLPALAEGNHTIIVKAFDTAGNSKEESIDLIIDLTSPNDFTPTLNVSSPTNNQTPELTFSTTDNIGIDHYEVKIDAGSFSPQTSSYTLPTLLVGDHTIIVRAFDAAGNSKDGSVNITVSLTIPSIVITAPTKNSHSNITDTTIKITDSDGVNIASVSAVGGTIDCIQTSAVEVNCTSVITTSGDLEITATDLAGNTVTVSEDNYSITPVVIIDDFTPVFDTGLITNNQNPTLTFSTNSSNGISHYEVKIDSGSFTTQTSPYALPTLSEGNHTIIVRAIDNSLEFKDVSVSIIIDLSSPVLTISLNVDSPTTNVNPVLTFSATDLFGVNYYQVQIDSGTFSTKTSPYTLPTLIEGDHTFTVEVYDNANNMAQKSISLTVNMPQPLIANDEVAAPDKTTTPGIKDAEPAVTLVNEDISNCDTQGVSYPCTTDVKVSEPADNSDTLKLVFILATLVTIILTIYLYNKKKNLQ